MNRASKIIYLFDISIFVIMVFLSGLNYLLPPNPITLHIDEAIIVILLFVLILKTKILFKVNYKFFIYVSLFIMYNIFLIAYNNLPLVNTLQIIISLKFLIFFSYFYLKKEEYKYILFKGILKVFSFTIILTIFLGLLEFFIAPSQYTEIFSIYRDGRGFNGIFLTSFFHSRSTFASYVLLILILLISLKSKKNISLLFSFYKNYYFWVMLLTGFIYLSTSRKELVIAFIFLSFAFLRARNINLKIIYMSISIVTMSLLLLLFVSIYLEVNQSTLGNSEYVRFIILDKGLEIFNYYFPFGSGPGTYGTVLSRGYVNVYEFFDVPRHIYLGYNEEGGAIYDTYIISLLAEYGLGIIFYIVILYNIFKMPENDFVKKYFFINKMTMMYIFTIFTLMTVTPVLTNTIGYIIFTILGLIHKRRMIYAK